MQENLLEVPEKLDALNDLTEETFTDHVAIGNHFVKFYAPCKFGFFSFSYFFIHLLNLALNKLCLHIPIFFLSFLSNNQGCGHCQVSSKLLPSVSSKLKS